MRRFVLGFAATAIATLYGFHALASSTTINGRLIDLACYSEDKSNTGLQHKRYGLICARACALEGFPVGLLTPDGKVYRVKGGLAANSNAKLVPHMAETVTVSGEIAKEDGQLTITVDGFK
jgi:hypothetical protein